MLSCPAYDYVSFAGSGFSKSALAWFMGPRYNDRQWLESVSPRTFIGSYSGPLRSVGHVHNVTNPGLPESRQVNDSMIGFMDRLR